jgi:hypothetical protein
MIVAIGRARRGVGRNAPRRLLIPLEEKVARSPNWANGVSFFGKPPYSDQSQFSAELHRVFSLKSLPISQGQRRS